MSCEIFDKDLIADVIDLNNPNITIQLGWLRDRFPSMHLSGIWRPIYAYPNNDNVLVSPLMPARTRGASLFTPCDCSDGSINTDPITEQIEESNLCSYCGDYQVEWRLYDANEQASPRTHSANCCSGACDVRFRTDDYLPKIPVLNHAYITGVADFKYKKEFPACNNAQTLGRDGFIYIPTSQRRQIGGSSTLYIDWSIRETISEIPYSKFTSHHDSEYLHNKSYKKSKMVSNTCGNFLMLSVNTNTGLPASGHYYINSYPILSGLLGTKVSGDIPSSTLPTPTQFAELPYGIDEEKYKNIFIHDEKIASYWKWNYTSGVLCWYRYYDMFRENDQRPISGVDLYIPPGDVFFATNDGPEPLTSFTNPTGLNGLIQSCPSGLKVVDNGQFKCIIPSGSEFLYISNNLYSKFYEIYYRLSQRTGSRDAMILSAVLATAPQYDEITVDLLKDTFGSTYTKNDFFQINLLNRDMQIATNFDSVSQLNYISNRKELISTLASKYGAYLYVPPRSNIDIVFNQTINSSFGLELDFDMVFNKNEIDWSYYAGTCQPLTNCSSRSFTKQYHYDQIIYGPAGFGLPLRTYCETLTRHNRSCVDYGSGVYTLTNNDFRLYSAIVLNNRFLKQVPSSSGCYIIKDIYPRIAERENTNTCSNCDQYSSFYRINNAESVECGLGIPSFCYATLARRFNNSPPQFTNDPLNRPERTLKDGTVRLERKYRATFFNPYIDTLAFHSQGGLMINSYPFGLDAEVIFRQDDPTPPSTTNSISINFETKDIGLKIYGIAAEYLQTNLSTSTDCKRFPVKESCKCWPINMTPLHSEDCNNPNRSSFATPGFYTPSLSTRLSPRLRQYGGYSQKDLDNLFGPSVLTAGALLNPLNSLINPENPYGCDSVASIDLHNYTNTTWTISPVGFSTSHADIEISVDEDINLLGNRFRAIIHRDGEDGGIVDYWLEYRPLLNAKRFATKVYVEQGESSDTFYANQRKVIFPKDSTIPSVLTVKLQNPFLESLILAAGGQENMVLFPPSGRLLTPYATTTVQLSDDIYRGNEVSKVTINLHQKYRKQYINFVLNSPRPMGYLYKGTFHPNSGLTLDSSFRKSAIKDDTIYYDAELRGNNFDEGFCLVGSFTTRAINAINNLHQFDYHKKLRLYLLINGRWYQYNGSNTNSFKVNNIIYPGKPLIHEYIPNKNFTKGLPSVFTAPVKKPNKFNFVYNKYNTNIPIQPLEFPILSERFYFSDQDRTTITIPGTRVYYRIPEIDPSIEILLPNIDYISAFVPPSNPNEFRYGSIIKFLDGSHWICLDPTKPNLRSSYVFSDFDYLQHNFSDLHLSFNKLSKSGYLYNSKRPTNFYGLFKSPTLRASTPIPIIEKSIFVKFVTKNGLPVKNLSKEDVYMLPYTRLKLAYGVRSQDYTLLNLNLGESSSFVISNMDVIVSEQDPDITNRLMQSKWGDLITFDGYVIDQYTNALFDPQKYYPKSVYDNIFYKTIINNHKIKNFFYRLEDTGLQTSTEEGEAQDLPLDITHLGLVYYSILHKYALGENTPYSIRADDYHNYLPFMDLNILSGSMPSSFYSLVQHYENEKIPFTGKISIAGIHRDTKPATEGYLPYGNNDLFWINFSGTEQAVSAFVPYDNFFSPTLRIDDSPFFFYRTFRETVTFPNAPNPPCINVFYPLGIADYTTNRDVYSFNNASSFGTMGYNTLNPHYRFHTYCDTDDGTCNNDGCYRDIDQGIKHIGWTNIKAQYRIGVSQKVTIPDVVPYFISYDAGLYNALGSDSIITIQRSELSPFSDLLPRKETQRAIDDRTSAESNCTGPYIIPSDYKANTINSIYQDAFTRSIPEQSHTQIVTNTDAMASEMLFRIMYGETQSINKNMFLVSTNNLTKKDLIAYTYPSVTASDLYNEILYNYDTGADMTNMSINGSFTVNGVQAVGKALSITIGNIVCLFNIRREEGKIYIVGSIGNLSIKERLFVESWEDRQYIIQAWMAGTPEPPPPSPANSYTSISLLGQCNILNRYFYGLWNSTCYDGPPIPAGSAGGQGTSPRGCERDLQSAISAGAFNAGVVAHSRQHATERYNRAGNGSCCCGLLGGCGGPCICFTIQEIGPFGVQYWCDDETWGGVSFIEPVTRMPEFRCMGFGHECTEYRIGYCGVDNCPACPDTLLSHDKINFNYAFQYCRYNFNLRGHAYRQRHRNLTFDPIVRPRPTECYNFVTPIMPGNPCTGSPDTGGDQISYCTTYPIITDVQQMEDFFHNNIVLGYTEIDAEPQPPDCTPGKTCRANIGAARCGDDPKVGWYAGCPNCAMPPCRPSFGGTHCSRGSYFKARGVNYEGYETRASGGIFGFNLCDVKHICGATRLGNHDVKQYRRIWLSTQIRSVSSYMPSCPSTVVSINYTSKTITVNVAGKSYCIPNTVNGCPRISISSSMEQLSVTDSVDSSCDKCSPVPAQIVLNPQTQTFLVRQERRLCVLGIKYSNSVNAPGVVCEGGGVPLSSVCAQCGGGPVEYGCMEWGTITHDSPQIWMGQTIECLRGLPGGIPGSLVGYELEEWQWELDQIATQRYAYLGDGAAHIPTADILEGVLPGSVSRPQILSFNVGGSKRTRAGIVGENVATAHVAYYEYTYIRPLTIQDILRNDNSLICAPDGGPSITNNIVENIRNSLSNNAPFNYYNNSLGYCQLLPYPPEFRQVFTQYQGERFFYYNRGMVDGSSYTETRPFFKQESNCDSAVSCYYNHSVFVCGQNDYCCFSDLSVANNTGIKPSCTINNQYGQPGGEFNNIYYP
jgi:hypothetical protein